MEHSCTFRHVDARRSEVGCRMVSYVHLACQRVFYRGLTVRYPIVDRSSSLVLSNNGNISRTWRQLSAHRSGTSPSPTVLSMLEPHGPSRTARQRWL